MALQPRFPENTALKAIAAQYLGWPRRYAAFKTLDVLEDHHKEVLITSEAIDNLTRMLTDMSAQAVTGVRRYIQDTTQDHSVICNASVNKVTDGSADCLEDKCGGGEGAVNSEFIEKLNPHRLFALRSEEMQLYIRQHQGQRPSPAAMDFILAAIDRLPELGINRSAYDAAVGQMGDMATALCILVIDRNRFHPETPIQNPGGVLRALTARHKAGKLNLVGSLIGLTARLDL